MKLKHDYLVVDVTERVEICKCGDILYLRDRCP